MSEGAVGFQSTIQAIKRHFDAEEFEAVLPLCNKAAEQRPGAQEIRRCRIFALVNLSRWSDALQACDKEQGKDAEAVSFEKAYCLYRLNRFQDALNALAKGGATGEAQRARLEAQVRYRMGDYESCAEMYEKLFANDPEEVGLLVNAAASYISSSKARQAYILLKDREDLLDSSYELCFNLACALIEEAKLGEAEERLQKAKELCVAELIQAEELAEEDTETIEAHEELAAIHVQLGCVLQRRGQTDEAMELYQRVLKQPQGQANEVDVTVLAVACNNVVSLRSEGKSLFDSLKRINVASKESLEHKLTRKQMIEITVNKCLLLLQARRFDEAKRELQRLRESNPGHPRVAIVQAAIAYAEKKTKACEDCLQAYLAEHPGNEEVLLCLSQLHAHHNRHEKSVEALAQLPVTRRVQPRNLEASVALHMRQKSPEKASASLREALDFWTSEEAAADEETLATVLRMVARLAQQLKDGALAAQALQLYLEKVDGGDVEALCGLVQALSGTDVERAEQYAQRLRVSSYDHLDAEELEMASIPKLGPPSKRREQETAEDGEEGEEKKEKVKKKKKRKIRLPKNYDPENPGPPPDPERWLPKHERAEYKKQMRKRDKNFLRGPQGAMVVEENAFRKQGPSTAQVEVSREGEARRKQGRKKQGKK